MLKKVAEGCKEELKRQRKSYNTPKNSVVDAEKEGEKQQWWMKRGYDLGQKAAAVFIQWSKSEQELDDMPHTWEQARELDQEDDKIASACTEKRHR